SSSLSPLSLHDALPISFYYQEMQELVRRMAKRLVAQHSRRKKAARRGQLDFRRTLRSGLAYDGVPFEPRWRRIKKDQPRIMVLRSEEHTSELQSRENLV